MGKHEACWVDAPSCQCNSPTLRQRRAGLWLFANLHGLYVNNYYSIVMKTFSLFKLDIPNTNYTLPHFQKFKEANFKLFKTILEIRKSIIQTFLHKVNINYRFSNCDKRMKYLKWIIFIALGMSKKIIWNNSKPILESLFINFVLFYPFLHNIDTNHNWYKCSKVKSIM